MCLEGDALAAEDICVGRQNRVREGHRRSLEGLGTQTGSAGEGCLGGRPVGHAEEVCTRLGEDQMLGWRPTPPAVILGDQAAPFLDSSD